MKKRFLLFVVIFLFLPLVQADYSLSGTDLCAEFDEISAEACPTYTTEFLCSYLFDNQWADTYYDAASDSCVFIEPEPANATAATTTTNTTAVDYSQELSDIDIKINTLTGRMTTLEEQLTTLDLKITEITTASQLNTQQITNLNNNFQSLNQQLGNQINTVSTGLAGLQQDLDNTTITLAAVEETSSTASFLAYSLLIILILAAGYGIYFFINRNKSPSTKKDLVRYFNHHLKKGKPHSEIKNTLHQAGWNPSMTDWAHKKATHTTTVNNRNKILAIVIGSIVILAIFVFLITGGTGKAILFKSDHTVEMECEPGKILAPDGFSCCSDANANQLCDIDEEFDTQRTTLEQDFCFDNKDCFAGKYCANNECTFLHELGSSEDCLQKCHYLSATISTNDGQTHNVNVGQGSYTAAGALDWTLMESPTFCNPNEVVVPIEIVKKRTIIEQGKPRVKIVSKKIIPLKKGETSYILKHFNAPELAFTLTVDNINLRCE